jgi:prepilin signal peptidase PulO-like enzyme (type II secretory pathway)
VSFLLQRGRCRRCGAALDWSYVWAELASGLLVLFVPLVVLTAGGGPLLAVLWTLAFLILLLITFIDLRLQMIPDELIIALALIGVVATVASGLWLANLAAAVGATLFFATLIFLTRGRGMGAGDAKLAFAIGLLFGWPSTLLLIMLAFVIGAMVGVALVARGTKKLQSTVPFGPFLAVAAATVFFFGPIILQSWYNLMV